MRRLAAAGTFVLAIVGFGCSEASKSTAPPPVTYNVAITAPQPTVMDGQTMQLTASVTRSDGQPVGVAAISWSTSNSSVATVNTLGLLSTKSAGSVTVTATAYGASAKTEIRVLPSPRDSAASIVAESVYVGQTIDLRAYLLNNGTPAFTDSTTWTSSDPTVGTVSGGVFTALKRGASTVTATRGSKVGVVDVLAQTHVTSLTLTPDTIQLPFGTFDTLYATASDSAGKRIYGRAVTWSVADTSNFKINAGVLTTKSNGAPTSGASTTITAVSEGAVAMAFVSITAPSGYTIALTVPQPWVEVGKTLQVNSAPQDPWNFYLANATLKWSSSDSTIARVSSSGVVTGVARGKATITAEGQGRKGSITLTVEKPVASIFFAPDTVFLSIHGSLVPSATLRDADGNTLTTRPVTWTSSDTTIVVVGNNAVDGFQASARGTPGRATVSASLDGVVGTLNMIVTPGTDQMFFVNVNSGVASYSTYDAQLHLQDVNGTPISGRGARIVSSDPGIVSVQPDTAAFANGSVTLHLAAGHSGDAILTATSGMLSATYIAHVAPVAVTLRLTSKPAELPIGTTYHLTTNAIQHVVDWTTSDPSIATVSDSGVVTPLAGGVVRIVARARDALGAAADSATISIRTQQAPVVTSVSSPQLLAGTSVTLTGQNFSTMPGANVVTIDGVPAQVTAATATQLTVMLPATTSFPCQPTHVAPLVVSTGPGLVTTSQQMLASAPQDSLAVGEADFWNPADSRCNEFVTRGSLYLLTISNGGTSASASTGFSFMVDTGSFASTMLASPSRIPVATFSRSLSRSLSPPVPHGAPAPGVLRIDIDSVRRAAIAHRNLLEKNRTFAAKLGSPLPVLRRAARLRARLDVVPATAAPDTGTKMFVRVPQLDTPDFCGDYRTIQARVVYSGTHAIILEDVQAPLAGLMDSYYVSVGTEFDLTTYNVITSNFGDPMAMDASLGGPGRVTMVFTPAVNEMGPTGFVVSCDFYPQTSAASSNQREMFYAVVPTSTAAGFNGEFTRDAWLHIIRSTVAHETKHIASMAEHFARQAPQQEESWLEEGTAMIAMELYARTVTQLKWKSGNGYKSALYCDVRPTICVGQPYTMFDHFIYLHDFLTPSEQHTPLGPTAPTDGSFYGSVWWLARWAVDQYATDEGAFFRALTQESSLTGVANLSARTGRPWSDLLRDWSLATLTSYLQPTFLIQNFTPHDARLTTPTWRLRDVFDGMANDFPNYFAADEMVTSHPQNCGDPATVVHAMPPGGVSLFVLNTCSGWKNFFRFQSDAGGTPSSALSIGVLRFQ